MHTYASGDVAKVAETFGEALPGREEIYPVAGAFFSELGNLNRFYQLFPFKNWAHCAEVRTEMQVKGVWPPRSDVRPGAQLVRHMVPATVSPLH